MNLPDTDPDDIPLTREMLDDMRHAHRGLASRFKYPRDKGTPLDYEIRALWDFGCWAHRSDQPRSISRAREMLLSWWLDIQIHEPGSYLYPSLDPMWDGIGGRPLSNRSAGRIQALRKLSAILGLDPPPAPWQPIRKEDAP